MEQRFIIEVRIPEMPADKDSLEISSYLGRLVRVPRGDSFLPEDTKVEVYTLNPDQCWQIIPAAEDTGEAEPAAAGEEKTEEVIPLNSEQCKRVGELLKIRLGRTVGVLEATLDTHTDTVYARIGQSDWVTLLLHQGSTFVRWSGPTNL